MGNRDLLTIAGLAALVIAYQKGLLDDYIAKIKEWSKPKDQPAPEPEPDTGGDDTTTPDPTPTPTPTPTPSPSGPGTILYQSTSWKNGKARHLTGAHQIDPSDNRVELAAGASRDWVIDGAGHSQISGDRARIYIHVNNYDGNMDVTYVPTAGLDDISLRLRSRHNEADPPENRFGGYGASIHHKEGYVKFQREDYHNVHAPGVPFKVNYSKPIVSGKPFRVRIEVKDEGNKVSTAMYCDYAMNGNFELLGKGYDNSPKPYMLDKAKLKAKSYTWIRVNGASAGKIDLSDVVIRSLDGTAAGAAPDPGALDGHPAAGE